MGGDRTFLKAQSLIWNNTLPIMGINTNRDEFVGALHNHFIDYGMKEQQSINLLEQMENDYAVTFEKRSRLLFERQQSKDYPDECKMLCLNETFCAE